MPTTPFSQFFKHTPPEIVFNILSFLEKENVIDLARLEKALASLQQEPIFWVKLLQSYYGIDIAEDELSRAKFIAVYSHAQGKKLGTSELPADQQKAKQYLEHAEQFFKLQSQAEDNAWSCYLLGEMYVLGYYPDPDEAQLAEATLEDFICARIEEGISLLQKAMALSQKQGRLDINAVYLLAYTYLGCKKEKFLNRTEGFRLLKLATDQGHNDAKHLLVLALFEDADLAEELELDSSAGYCYLQDLVQTNDKNGLEILLDLFTREKLSLPVVIGCLSEEQRNILTELKLKYKLTDEAATELLMVNLLASQGEIWAIKSLAKALASDEIFKNTDIRKLNKAELAEDLDKACKYLELGVSFGDSECAEELVQLYADPKLVCYDMKKAIAAMQKGIKLNNPECNFQLGLIYQQGLHGYAKDPEKAKTYFDQAISPDRSYDAQLAEIYAIAGDKAQCLHYLLNGFRQGDTLSAGWLHHIFGRLPLPAYWIISKPEFYDLELDKRLKQLTWPNRITEEDIQWVEQAVEKYLLEDLEAEFSQRFTL